MAVKPLSEKPATPHEIDLSGPNGNAFYLLSLAKGYAKQLGLNSKKITAEMMAGDYDNLVAVFDSYFGDYVTLYR